MVNRRYGVSRAVSLALAALAVLLTALASTGEAQTLKFVPHADLKNIDPIWTTAYISRNHGYMVWDTLFALNEKLEITPQMVEKYKVSGDGLTYTFTLRQGLRFHDGSPVTAKDCVASIRRWGKRDGMGQKLIEVTASIDVVNENTFKLVLKEKYGLVLESLGKLSSNVPFMMPERLAKTDPFKQVPDSIGSGPFKFVKDEWVPGNKVVYVKNETYKPRSEPASLAAGGKVVKVDRVEWIYIPDQVTAQSALVAGEVDYFENPQHDLFDSLDKSPGIRTALLSLGQQGWLRPNHLWPPFDNPKARQALMWIVNQADYMGAAIGNPRFWQICAALFVCGTPYESDVGTEAVLGQNLDKAKQLMKEAGYQGEKIVLMDPADIPQLHSMALVTAQLLRKAGLNVDLQSMDWSTLTSRRAEKKSPKEGGWNIFHTYWVTPDVFNPTANIGVSGGGKEKAWFGWPEDKRLEDMRSEWARTTDAASKKNLAVQIQKRAYEVVPYVPIGQWYDYRAYRDNLEGVILAPVPFLWNITKR